LLPFVSQTPAFINHYEQFSLPCITDPEFELVALHPEHFLPGGAVLTIYGPGRGNCKDYVVAHDRCLRESPDPGSARLPSFCSTNSSRSKIGQLNVFLVILNADMKFRKYFELPPPAMPLPTNVLNLMCRTMELVDLLYWRPFPEVNTKGYDILAEMEANRQMNRRIARVQRLLFDSGSNDIDMDDDDDDDGFLTLPSVRTLARRHAHMKRISDADLETRREYWSAMMSGHGTGLFLSIIAYLIDLLDMNHDLSLFEDTIPLKDGMY
jgi:hypothetical protein